MKSVNDVSERVSTLSPVQIGDLVGEGFASCELASLEAKGEGVTLPKRAPRLVVQSARVTPSPRFSKLATLAKSLTGNESE